jgi:hypothetical protein
MASENPINIQNISRISTVARGNRLQKASCRFKRGPPGEMAEWLKAHAWKACVRETVPWVRIPLSPPYHINFSIFLDFIAPDWSAKYVRHFLWFSIFTA